MPFNRIVEKVMKSKLISQLKRVLRGQTTWQLASSMYFDRNYYSIQAGREFSSRFEAIRHYKKHGERKGLKPSPLFDPLFYKSVYPDVAHLPFLFSHFVAYGVNEGRVGVFNIDHILIKGGREYNASLPTVVVITHELSETGAPILAWNIINNIPSNWNVISISISDGRLKEEFTEKSCVFFNFGNLSSGNYNSILAINFAVKEILSRYNIDFVISNSVVSEVVATSFAKLSVPVITLIHEFSTYIPKEILINSVLYSDHVVFSSKTILSDAEKKLGFSLNHASVIPQGKSIVPKQSDSNNDSYLLDIIDAERKNGKFIIIGCGHVQIRKGVDLFIAGCDQIAKSIGTDNVHFVWVGNGYMPDTDYGYSIWLKDQVERSSLNNCFSFIAGLDSRELERLYSLANVMFLSSRLDPLPNVAIDAVSVGIPVVCFDKATGLAEYLEGFESLQTLIAPYLDVHKAADIIVNLLRKPALVQSMQEDLSKLSNMTFSMKFYVERLLKFNGVLRERQGALAAEIVELMDSGLIEQETLQAPGQMADLKDSVGYQIRLDWIAKHGVNGGVRRPFSGFSPHIYREANNLTLAKSSTVDWLRHNRPEGPWKRDVVNLQQLEVKNITTNHKVAIHIHAHYEDQLRFIINEIALSDCQPDIFISSSSLDFNVIERELRGLYSGEIAFIRVPNSGRDIGPMLSACAEHLLRYDVVGHVHTKKSLLVSDRKSIDNWVRFLFDNCIGSNTKSIDKILGLFAENPRLGLCFPEDPNIVGWTENLSSAKGLLKDVDLTLHLPDAIEFPVGNMFYFRPVALAPLFNREFSASCFPSEPLAYDGTMLHAIERLLPLIVESQNFEWITTRIPGVTR
ncbi:rhamnan synthesis F family protein [Pseudochrobactrum sp. XF203]|uniref:rhamnan synthesis F family protein n=1 Tax=Pseudochrobactrum sp. XF203 TaxID=2879116 RepID=UPI001CE3726E|nr:rhamnan synthesis F family protein [Pseudochrobactrum sp. XF203]UCA47068.1 glycosyltransferase [Pseudochrobactrum sp. XF203]